MNKIKFVGLPSYLPFFLLPFEIKVPNAETRESIVELESGKGEKFTSVNELMADINAVD